MTLSKEEIEILKSVENGEYQKASNFDSEKEKYQEIARSTMRKDKRVNIRMTERDLLQIQKVALQEGLPYQTFISSILHKFINGRLVEKA